jgi:hypothetical protein
MIRELVTAAAIAGAAIGVAPAADADPPHYKGDVPGMAQGVTQGYACDSWERFTFGRGPNGQALTCHFIPNQFPAKETGFWMISYPLYGVQEIGAPCPNPQSAAQAPDGLPLLCLGAQGWQPGIFVGGAGPYAPPGVVPPEGERPE